VRPDLVGSPSELRRQRARLFPLDPCIQERLTCAELAMKTALMSGKGSRSTGGDAISCSADETSLQTSNFRRFFPQGMLQGSIPRTKPAVPGQGSDASTSDSPAAATCISMDDRTNDQQTPCLHISAAPIPADSDSDSEMDEHMIHAYRRARARIPSKKKSQAQHESVVHFEAPSPTVSPEEDEEYHVPTRFGPYSALEVIRIRRIFESMDTTRSGSIDITELAAASAWRQLYSEEDIH